MPNPGMASDGGGVGLGVGFVDVGVAVGVVVGVGVAEGVGDGVDSSSIATVVDVSSSDVWTLRVT
ncbi:MAG: hypothetical protein ACOC42_04025, partial [Halobacteriota archaeon]